jgi:type-F conjugative transfer system pilin assembly protein TrbC
LLHLMTFLLFSTCYIDYASAEGSSASCQTSSETSFQLTSQICLNEEFVHKSGCYQSLSPQDSFVKLLQKDSLQRVEDLVKDPSFQHILAELQNSSSQEDNPTLNEQKQAQTKKTNGELYLFVSFSMGEKALLNLAHEAKQYGATLVLRGFKDGSYTKTSKALQKIIEETGQGILIDPELYELFRITAVPTCALAKPFALQPQTRTQTPIHDKIQGHVSVRYALEQFAKKGDLMQEAQLLLKPVLLNSRGLL